MTVLYQYTFAFDYMKIDMFILWDAWHQWLGTIHLKKNYTKELSILLILHSNILYYYLHRNSLIPRYYYCSISDNFYTAPPQYPCFLSDPYACVVFTFVSIFDLVWASSCMNDNFLFYEHLSEKIAQNHCTIRLLSCLDILFSTYTHTCSDAFTLLSFLRLLFDSLSAGSYSIEAAVMVAATMIVPWLKKDSVRLFVQLTSLRFNLGYDCSFRCYGAVY